MSLAAAAQSVPVVTGDKRVDKLLSRMTLQEKLTLIHGTHEDPKVYQGQAGYLGGIPRLGIPGLRFADGPPGVLTRHPSQGETATMGVAATFSLKDAEDNGIVIGREARSLGIETVYQDLALVNELTVYHNMFLKREKVFGPLPFLNNRKMRQEARAHLDRIGVRIPSVNTEVGRLSGGQRQAIAIARAVSGNARILLLDEPLAAMGAKEGALILELIHNLKQMG